MMQCTTVLPICVLFITHLMARLQVHETSRLMAANELLRKNLLEAKNTTDEDAGETWK